MKVNPVNQPGYRMSAKRLAAIIRRCERNEEKRWTVAKIMRVHGKPAATGGGEEVKGE